MIISVCWLVRSKTTSYVGLASYVFLLQVVHSYHYACVWGGHILLINIPGLYVFVPFSLLVFLFGYFVTYAKYFPVVQSVGHLLFILDYSTQL